MSDQTTSVNLPAHDIFIKLFEKVFFEFSQKTNRLEFNPDNVEQKHFSLLMAWPGILLLKLSSLTDDKEDESKLETLKELLFRETEIQKIYDVLENLIKVSPIPERLLNEANEARNNNDTNRLKNISKEVRSYFPKIIEKFVLLAHPMSLHFNYKILIRDLIFSIGNYFILCCMISKCLKEKTEETYLSLNNIQNSLKRFEITDKIDVYNFSLIFFNLMFPVAENELNLAVNNDQYVLTYQDSIPIPLTKLFLHQFIAEKNANIAVIDHNHSTTDKQIQNGTIGFAIDINIFQELDYNLWQIGVIDSSPECELIKGSFLFRGDKDNINIYDYLFDCLFQVSKLASVITLNIINSWINFIDRPAEIIDEHLDKYDKWIFSLLDNYHTREEFLNFKAFARVIGSLDTELEYDIISDVRNEYKEAKKYHIPMKLRRELLKAKDELDLFVGLVIKNPDVWLEEQTLEYFDQYRSKYTYLNYLEHDDVREIIFSTEANANRNNRRKILPIINNKLGGKTFRGESTLTKLLGLEKSKEKYIKYAK